MTGSDRLAGHGRDAGPEAAVDGGRRATAWLARELTAERERWALWLPVAYGAGTVVYFWLPAEPGAMVAPLVLAAIALAGFGLRRRSRWPIAVLAAAAVVAGFTMAQWHTARVGAPVLSKRLGPTAVSGTVHDLSVPGKGARVVLREPGCGASRRRRRRSGCGCASRREFPKK